MLKTCLLVSSSTAKEWLFCWTETVIVHEEVDNLLSYLDAVFVRHAVVKENQFVVLCLAA